MPADRDGQPLHVGDIQWRLLLLSTLNGQTPNLTIDGCEPDERQEYADESHCAICPPDVSCPHCPVCNDEDAEPCKYCGGYCTSSKECVENEQADDDSP